MVIAQMTPNVIRTNPVTFNTVFILFILQFLYYLIAMRNIQRARVAKLPWNR